MLGDGGDFGLNLRGLLPGPTSATCTDQDGTGTLTSKQISSGHTTEHEGTPKKRTEKRVIAVSALKNSWPMGVPWQSSG